MIVIHVLLKRDENASVSFSLLLFFVHVMVIINLSHREQQMTKLFFLAFMVEENTPSCG